jgi:hypothetical protein
VRHPNPAGSLLGVAARSSRFRERHAERSTRPSPSSPLRLQSRGTSVFIGSWRVRCAGQGHQSAHGRAGPRPRPCATARWCRCGPCRGKLGPRTWVSRLSSLAGAEAGMLSSSYDLEIAIAEGAKCVCRRMHCTGRACGSCMRCALWRLPRAPSAASCWGPCVPSSRARRAAADDAGFEMAGSAQPIAGVPGWDSPIVCAPGCRARQLPPWRRRWTRPAWCRATWCSCGWATSCPPTSSCSGRAASTTRPCRRGRRARAWWRGCVWQVRRGMPLCRRAGRSRAWRRGRQPSKAA